MDSREILRKLREDTGMNRRQFSDYFGIPYRTIQDWELGNRKMPEYLLRLMVYRANMEKLVKSDK
jgi:DNA-binding transcriptional regulator YiaG